MEYWEKLKLLSEENGLTTTTFGRKTGLSYQYLSTAIQKEYKIPSKSTVMKLSNAFDLSPNEIFDNADNEFFQRESNKYNNAFWKKFVAPKMNKYMTITRISRETDINRVYLSGLKNGYIAYPNEKTVVLLARYFNEPSLKWFRWINNNLDQLKMKEGEINNVNEKIKQTE